MPVATSGCQRNVPTAAGGRGGCFQKGRGGYPGGQQTPPRGGCLLVASARLSQPPLGGIPASLFKQVPPGLRSPYPR